MLLLYGCATVNRSLQFEKQDDDFLHCETGLLFQPNILGYKLSKISDLDNGDVSITYQNKQDAVSIYIYPFNSDGIGREDCLKRECEQIKAIRSMCYPICHVLKEDHISVENDSGKIEGYRQHYKIAHSSDMEPFRDSIYLFQIDGKLIKFMFTGFNNKLTYKNFDNFVNELFKNKQKPILDVEIYVDDPPDSLNIILWLVYAKSKKQSLTNAFQNDTFTNEIKARTEMIEFYDKKNYEESSYFYFLQKIYNAGFIDEYVWMYHQRDWWFKPEKLRLDEFDKWKIENLVGFVPETRAILHHKKI